MKIKITKLKEAPDPLYPHNISTGAVIIGEMNNSSFKIPEINERFQIGLTPEGYWSTSAVQEIIDKSTFRTYNSIYRYKVLSVKEEGEVMLKEYKFDKDLIKRKNEKTIK